MAIYKRIIDIVMPVKTNITSILSRNILVGHKECMIHQNQTTAENKMELPPKPKRPLTPFIRYTMSQRDSIKKQNPSLKMFEVVKLMGQNWQSVDVNEKEKLRDLYKKELDEYAQQMMIYERNLTDEQKTMMKNERARRLEIKEKINMKSKLIELGRPKRPPTTFVLYMMSKLNTRSKDVVFSDWLSGVAKEWANLPADTKLKFHNESVKLREQYNTDLQSWESKMIKMGHIDVVRRKVLLELKGKTDVA